MLEIDPNSSQAHLGLFSVYRANGMHDQAAAETERYFSGIGLRQIADAERRAYATAGWKALLLKDIELTGDSKNLTTYYPAGVAIDYAKLGDKDKAFAVLEVAYKERASLMFLKVDPGFDSLRSDSRFNDLLRRVGFPQ